MLRARSTMLPVGNRNRRHKFAAAGTTLGVPLGFNRKFENAGMKFVSLPAMFQVAGMEFETSGMMPISVLV